MTRSCTSQKVGQPPLVFVWVNSTSHTLTQVIAGVKQHVLTLLGVSSTSDKGQTDSHKAPVHAAQPAPEKTARLVHVLAAEKTSLDRKGAASGKYI